MIMQNYIHFERGLDIHGWSDNNSIGCQNNMSNEWSDNNSTECRNNVSNKH